MIEKHTAFMTGNFFW